MREVNTLIRYLDSYRLSLKAVIQNLTFLFSLLDEYWCLPDQRLQLEIFAGNQIISRGFTVRSSKGSFKFANDYSTFLTETAFDFHPSLNLLPL